MHPSRPPAGAALVFAAMALLTVTASRAGSVEVQVSLPAPQKIDTTGMKRLLVGGFRANDNPELDLPKEINASLRSLFHKHTGFEVLEVDPLPLPEQPIEEAIRNTDYWKRLGARFNADLIVAGTIDFGAHDQSGFVQEDVIAELTGQRMRRSRWVERESFRLDLGLLFFRASSGELMYEGHFIEEMVFDGKMNDDLPVLHQVFDRVGDAIPGIV